jgi:hypothetical protein
MNKPTLSAVVLAVIGIVFIALGSVEFNRQEEVLRLGNLTATATTKKTVPAFRYAGVACVAAGIAIAGFGYLQRRK